MIIKCVSCGEKLCNLSPYTLDLKITFEIICPNCGAGNIRE